MNEVQAKLAELQENGWSLAAIADETGNHLSTIEKWKSGMHQPSNSRLVLRGLDSLLGMKAPKRRRYPGTHHLQRRKAEQEG